MTVKNLIFHKGIIKYICFVMYKFHFTYGHPLNAFLIFINL